MISYDGDEVTLDRRTLDRWPDSREEREQALAVVEAELLPGEPYLGLEAIEEAVRRAERVMLPAELRALFDVHQWRARRGSDDLDRLLTAEVSRELCDYLRDRVAELPDELSTAPWLGRIDDPSPLVRLKLIIGMIVSSARPISRNALQRSMKQVFALYEDAIGILTLCRRAVSPGRSRGSCRHAAAALQVLFLASQRTFGNGESQVLSVGGLDRFGHKGLAHQWNWYVDHRVGAIASLDLGEARVAYERDGTILGWELDERVRNDTSAFCDDLFSRYTFEFDSLYRNAVVPAALAVLVDPTSVRGEALLFQLACQWGLHRPARTRLERFLGNRGFDERFPGWRDRVNSPKHWTFRAYQRIASADSARLQLDLLDAIGVT